MGRSNRCPTDAQDSVECRILRRLKAHDTRLRDLLADTTTIADAVVDAGLSRARYDTNVIALDATPVEMPVGFLDDADDARGGVPVEQYLEAARVEFDDPAATYELPCPNCGEAIISDNYVGR